MLICWLEVAANNSLNRWFKKHDLVDYGTAVLADEGLLAYADMLA